MKRMLIAIMVFLLLCGMTLAAWGNPYLASEIPTGATPTASEIEVNGTVQPGIVQLSADGLSYLLLDLAGFPKGIYTFRVRWHDGMNFWSDWSDPFVAGKPAKSGNVKIVEQ